VYSAPSQDPGKSQNKERSTVLHYPLLPCWSASQRSPVDVAYSRIAVGEAGKGNETHCESTESALASRNEGWWRRPWL